MKKKIVFMMIAVILMSAAGCRSHPVVREPAETVIRYGTTAYGLEMGNAGLNPHQDYSGWSAVRYGVGETLFRFTDTMELEPWLATGYEQLDEYSVKITIRDQVFFSSGRKLDATAVKQCLEHLIQVHGRARMDLKIKEITADDQELTIILAEENAALLHYLSDPYGAIIDLDYGITAEQNVAGTGPFIATRVTDQEIDLVKNENYWGDPAQTDQIHIKAITDGDTLTMALQSGDIDIAQGLPYVSHELFKADERFRIDSVDTSRMFFITMNFEQPLLQDVRVREAIAMAIDKESFSQILLQGNGTIAKGPFPDYLAFGDQSVADSPYDPEAARELLLQAGLEDNDQDGYLEWHETLVTLRWLTYPGRQELPLLAELVQENLKAIGIRTEITTTANHLNVLEQGEWDLYGSSFVAAPTGDPDYFFQSHTLVDSPNNRGGYQNEKLSELEAQLAGEWDQQNRAMLAQEMTQLILDDHAFVFVTHLKMSMVMKSNITGFHPHPCDYYEITSALRLE